MVGSPHRARIVRFELSELILLLKLDKQLPVERFEATASQSARGAEVHTEARIARLIVYRRSAQQERGASGYLLLCAKWLQAAPLDVHPCGGRRVALPIVVVLSLINITSNHSSHLIILLLIMIIPIIVTLALRCCLASQAHGARSKLQTTYNQLAKQQ